jgi:hypothetical protein
MKSVTIRDKKGMILVKVMETKKGEILVDYLDTLIGLDIEVRDNQNYKVDLA